MPHAAWSPTGQLTFDSFEPGASAPQRPETGPGPPWTASCADYDACHHGTSVSPNSTTNKDTGKRPSHVRKLPTVVSTSSALSERRPASSSKGGHGRQPQQPTRRTAADLQHVGETDVVLAISPVLHPEEMPEPIHQGIEGPRPQSIREETAIRPLQISIGSSSAVEKLLYAIARLQCHGVPCIPCLPWLTRTAHCRCPTGSGRPHSLVHAVIRASGAQAILAETGRRSHKSCYRRGALAAHQTRHLHANRIALRHRPDAADLRRNPGDSSDSTHGASRAGPRSAAQYWPDPQQVNCGDLRHSCRRRRATAALAAT